MKEIVVTHGADTMNDTMVQTILDTLWFSSGINQKHKGTGKILRN